MRKSMIAVAIAGSLAAGAASANGTTLHYYSDGDAVARHVQYYERDWHRNVMSSPAIDEREARIADRIERGAQSGQLTRQETWRLRRQLERVQEKERAFVADGRLAPWEERELMRDLDRLAANLRYERHDEDRRY